MSYFISYHPFDYIVDVLKTAALDPEVTSIKIAYIGRQNSRVAEALIASA